mmetsp:Transcript_16095/g.37931  ORF Transcript_16095/g.37931 Transcript_16095/m.37931 type:complete len:203 (-) Transcript_16095:564-1172(-)
MVVESRRLRGNEPVLGVQVRCALKDTRTKPICSTRVGGGLIVVVAGLVAIARAAIVEEVQNIFVIHSQTLELDEIGVMIVDRIVLDAVAMNIVKSNFVLGCLSLFHCEVEAHFFCSTIWHRPHAFRQPSSHPKKTFTKTLPPLSVLAVQGSRALREALGPDSRVFSHHLTQYNACDADVLGHSWSEPEVILLPLLLLPIVNK